MGIAIRKALPEDARDYAHCRISCWQSAYKGIIDDEYLSAMSVEEKKYVEKYKTSLINPGICEYYCVMYSQKMIGFLIIDMRDCDIWAIYLVEEFRGKGYGKEVMDFAVTRLKPKAKKEISLWVFEENTAARRFYERYRFRLDSQKKESVYGKLLIQLRYILKV
jgi:Acetyltransferases